jgi:hypothetical protein
MVTVLEPVKDLVEGCNDMRAVAEFSSQAKAEKWVLEEGKEEVTYWFARFLRPATKRIRKKAVVV